MPKRTSTTNPISQTKQCFAKLLSRAPELSALRADYALKAATERRAAAGWAYDESMGNSLFGAALKRLQGQRVPAPGWPPGFAALAIDPEYAPEYAPALLTVGCYEHGCGRKEEGMRLLLQLTQLSPDTEDWIEIIDKAGQALMDAGDAASTCRLYEAALKARPAEQEFIIGLGWALCRAGKQDEAVPGEFVIEVCRGGDPAPLLLSPMLGKLLVHEKCDFSDGASAGQTGRSLGNWRDPSRSR